MGAHESDRETLMDLWRLPAVVSTGVLALALGLSGCGDDKPADGAAAPPGPGVAGPGVAGPEPAVGNQQEQSFLTALTREHSEATALAVLYSDTVQPVTNAEIDDLAAEIEESIEPRLEAVLGAYDVPAGALRPPDPAAGERLSSAGAQIERTFLELMTANHQRTVAAARAYLAEGASGELADLARAVAQELSERIDRMQRLLAGL
ncbi:MAG: DUF305 domain-containing protein [Sporichthyaceae bacterium]